MLPHCMTENINTVILISVFIDTKICCMFYSADVVHDLAEL